jgi:hypothetical protein
MVWVYPAATFFIAVTSNEVEPPIDAYENENDDKHPAYNN